MKPVWRSPVSRHGRDAIALSIAAIVMLAFAVIGNSMTRPLDGLFEADTDDAGAIRIVTQHVRP